MGNHRFVKDGDADLRDVVISFTGITIVKSPYCVFDQLEKR